MNATNSTNVTISSHTFEKIDDVFIGLIAGAAPTLEFMDQTCFTSLLSMAFVTASAYSLFNKALPTVAWQKALTLL